MYYMINKVLRDKHCPFFLVNFNNFWYLITACIFYNILFRY